jgi:hypothetical protein
MYLVAVQLCYSKSHPIGSLKKLTINEIAGWPMVLLDNESNTRSVLDAAFARVGRLADC